MQENSSAAGLRPALPGGAYNAPSDPVAGGEGGWLPPAKKHHPRALALLASPLLCPPHSKISSDAADHIT